MRASILGNWSSCSASERAPSSVPRSARIGTISRLTASWRVASVPACNRASFRPTITTLSATGASARASAKPIPEVAPVTTKVLASPLIDPLRDGYDLELRTTGQVHRALLEFFDRRSQVDLMAPRARILRVQVPVRLGDRRGIQERACIAFWEERPQARDVDLAIDHNMAHVNSLRSELASHRLSQG